MAFSLFCAFVAVFYGVLLFFDLFFKSCMHYPYFAFMEHTGLKVGFFNFTWTTTAFNRFLLRRRGKRTTRFLQKFFTFGSFITIVAFLPFSLWTIIRVPLNEMAPDLTEKTTVTAIVPGVNLPLDDFWIYFMSIAVSTVLHEFGHALAAVNEDVQLLSFGITVYAILPMAYVQLNTDHLNSLSINRRLRIYCAGVWHNLVTALIALLLFLATPTLFSLAYKSNLGVRVMGIPDYSPLKGERGIGHEDVITSLNGCKVNNALDWRNCLMKSHERYGLCITAEYISQNDEMIVEAYQHDNAYVCCKLNYMDSLCFEYIEPKNADADVVVLPGQFYCLEPRKIVENSYQLCTETDEYRCKKNHHCLRPSLNNATYLLILQRQQYHPVLYLGTPRELEVLTVDQYFPRLNVLSLFSPKQFERFTYFVFIFSMGIGFLNVIPCYGADGHHIARNLIQLLAQYLNKDSNFVTLYTMITIIFGTIVTWVSLFYLFLRAIMQSGLD
ncbi:hypothetical protein JYU34_017729 [Plutella xylostella]|uniref:Membrane-bound transcription factor site-2 protease n=1 Tax=Plutella xylostella TaxID=51655 RepID=A0ABQ7Q1R7_PLUXY|nr:hypothetical protein JYU34_017729 [Plutella xylostella]